MKEFTQLLHAELRLKLEELDKNYDPLNLTDSRLAVIVEAIEEIKQKLLTFKFLSEKDEIEYFKHILPPILSLHIYYSDRVEWDRVKLLGSPESRYKFTDLIYTQAENFRDAHEDFYKYCRDGKNHMDRIYFLRDSPANRERAYTLRSIIDPSSPTIQCELTAMLIAYTRLEHEVKIQVAENRSNPYSIHSEKSKLRWTGKQIDLIELGYCLKETGSFNHGNASLNEIFDFFGAAFEVDTGNTSRLFQDIITRKGGNTSFLDLMKVKLIQRINDVLK